MKRVLALRLSAFGDVAMTVPVIDAVARQYPDLQITVLSRPFMQPLFAGMPANVCFRGVNINDYKGIHGLFRLFRELKREGYDAVADLHDVLRSKVIRTLFRLWGAKTAHIDKGRAGRKALVHSEKKQLNPLPTSFLRYQAVFDQLGYPVSENRFRSIFDTPHEKGDCHNGKGDASLFSSLTGRPDDGKHWIGIAPFAAHPGKTLPEKTMLAAIDLLARRLNHRLFLFGGKAEQEKLEAWAAPHPNVLSLAGKLPLAAELSLISHLDVMVSMDSANMHLASLCGVPVVSVWGATHPYAGFMGWRQSEARAVQQDLSCRPCSIFGNKPCLRGDYACLTHIQPQEIARKVENLLATEKPHPANS